MDFRNNSIPFEKVTSTDVNKAIQRSLTKAAARHGLGLYIYAGEDLPECERDEDKKADEPVPEPRPAERSTVTTAPTLPNPAPNPTPEAVYLLNAMKKMREARGCSTEENKKIFKEQHMVLGFREHHLLQDQQCEPYQPSRMLLLHQQSL